MGTIFPPVFIGFPHPFIVPQKKVLMILKKQNFGGCHVVLKPNHDRSTEIHEKWGIHGIRMVFGLGVILIEIQKKSLAGFCGVGPHFPKIIVPAMAKNGLPCIAARQWVMSKPSGTLWQSPKMKRINSCHGLKV